MNGGNSTRIQDDVTQAGGLRAMQASRYVIPERDPIDITQEKMYGADFMQVLKTLSGVKNLGTCQGGTISADTDIVFYINDNREIASMCIRGGKYPTALLHNILAYAVTESTWQRDDMSRQDHGKRISEIEDELKKEYETQVSEKTLPQPDEVQQSSTPNTSETTDISASKVYKLLEIQGGDSDEYED